MWNIESGDVLEILKNYSDNYFDGVLSDPPYGLSFLNKAWDYNVPKKEVWEEIFRVLKPGATILIFGGTRTFHRLVCEIEDGGFEIKDTICWIHSQGFPKSKDISKGIDQHFGAKREVIESISSKSGGTEHLNRSNKKADYRPNDYQKGENIFDITKPSTNDAQKWEGYGTALKPAVELICLAIKPIEKNYVNNALKYGVAGINIDESRIKTNDNLNGGAYAKKENERYNGTENWHFKIGGAGEFQQPKGRWPANVILSHHPDCKLIGTEKIKNKSGGVSGNEPSLPADGVCYGVYNERKPFNKYGDAEGNEIVEKWECTNGCPVKELDNQTGILQSDPPNRKIRGNKTTQSTIPFSTGQNFKPNRTDSGGGSRFFQCVDGCPIKELDEQSGILKSGKDINPTTESVKGFFNQDMKYYSKDANYGDEGGASRFYYCAKASPSERNKGVGENIHPTVKPLALDKYLAKLILPPKGDSIRKLLVPFSGSGSEMIGALKIGWDEVIGIEREQEYIDIATKRLTYWCGSNIESEDFNVESTEFDNLPLFQKKKN